MNIPSLFESLNTRFALLKNKIGLSNSVNDFSINIELETVFIKILNTVYETNYVNSNTFKSNSPGIDAIDLDNKLALQITSTYTTRKILSSYEKAIKNDIHLSTSTLKFLFLRDTKKLRETVRKEILKIAKNKFTFNADEDIIDTLKIYQKLFFDQDVTKTIKVLNILDEYLGFLPETKSTGFITLAISFSEKDNDLDNIFLLVESLLRERINVITHSRKFYELFAQSSNKFFDHLILQKEIESIDHIKHHLIILSDDFILNNISGKIQCPFLNKNIIEDYKTRIISFNPSIEIPETEIGDRFRAFNSITANTKDIKKFTDNMVSYFFNFDIPEVPIDTKLILDQLEVNYDNFNRENLESTKDYSSILLSMENNDISLIYLVLEPSYNAAAVALYCRFLKAKYKTSITILVPKNPTHKTRRVLEALKKRTTPKNIHFIDEYLFEKSSRKFEQNPMQIIDDFIEPVILRDGITQYIPDILSWITEESKPSIGIIKASGGIGKTTLSEKIHDTLINPNKYKYIVLFINPTQFLDQFRKTDFSDEEEYDLYNLFKKAHPQGNIINEVSFYNNYSQGNILMILDGIDEIISTVTSFTLDSFLTKLSRLNKRIGRGKILITCRDIYIDEIEYYINHTSNDAIVIYELLPFNENLARDFFKLHFETKSKINKGIDLLKNFVLEKQVDNQDYIYPPFVLEIISDILKNNLDEMKLNEMFNSELLLDGYKTDYVLNQTFNRERIKKGEHGFDLNIDDQTAFFALMVIERSGKMEIEDFNSILKKIRHFPKLEETVLGLTDHPLLKKNNGDADFYLKYKFLHMDFAVIGLYNLIKKSEIFQLTSRSIDFLSHRANFNSIISKGLLSRLKFEFNQQIKGLDLLKELILKIQKFSLDDTEVKNQALSNLFIICYEFNSTLGLDRLSSNQLIKYLFSSDNSGFIEDFHLNNIPENLNLILDFSDCYFENSTINNYPNFIDCKFNGSTYFTNSCLIDNVNPSGHRKIDELTLKLENFHEIQGDNSLHQVLKVISKGSSGIEDDLRRYLKKYFVGNLLKKTMSKRDLFIGFDNKSYFESIHELFIEFKIIKKIEKEYTINKTFQSKVQKFVFQGKIFREINRIGENITSGI